MHIFSYPERTIRLNYLTIQTARPSEAHLHPNYSSERGIPYFNYNKFLNTYLCNKPNWF